MHVVIYHGEKPKWLEPTERKFIVNQNRENDLDSIHFENNYKAVRRDSGWILYSPTEKCVAVHGWLEI